MNIIQIGTNDGNDHVNFFIRQNEELVENAVFVDAQEECIESAKATYKDLLSDNKKQFFVSCISDDNDEFKAICIPKDIVNDPGWSHLVSTKLSQLKMDQKDCIERKVKSVNINTFLDQFQFQIDRLYIDVEGLDTALILELDLDKFKIPYIFYEEIHGDGNHFKGTLVEKCREKLSNSGYFIKQYDNYNLEATRK